MLRRSVGTHTHFQVEVMDVPHYKVEELVTPS